MDPVQTAANKGARGRFLALDVGEKRIGVAVSDPLGILASPLTVIHHTRWQQDIQRVLDLARREGVVGIVVGVPYFLDGRASEQTQKVLRFVQRLRERSDLPVYEWNEALSTEEARTRLRDARPRARRRQTHVDAYAAAVILQDFLEAIRSGTSSPTTLEEEKRS